MHILHCMEFAKVFGTIRTNRPLDEEEYLAYASCLQFITLTNQDAIKGYNDAKAKESGDEDQLGSGVPRD